MNSPLKIDVVIPVYNEEGLLPVLRQRVRDSLMSINGAAWRLILVNDGSSDKSWELISAYHREDSNIVAVDLARNFGHQPAILAGLQVTDADVVVILDGDLQDPPELIPELIEKWRETGCQIVTAKRRSRKERGLRGALLRLFHVLFGWISDFPIEMNTGTFSLISQAAMIELLRLDEQNRFFPGLRSWVGYHHEVVLYDRDERLEGEPKQTFSRLFKYALDAVFSFSYKPLRLILIAGSIAFALGFAIAMMFGVRQILGLETAEQGFTTLVVLILMFGGTQLIAIGVLGEYMGRIYDEVKKRPHYLVRATLGLDKTSEDN